MVKLSYVGIMFIDKYMVNTVKPVKNGNSNIDKTEILITIGSYMKVRLQCF